MKRLTFSLLCLLFGVSLLAQDVQWRGENRDGIYKETELLKEWPDGGPKLLWHYDELGPGHGSAAISGETVYTSGTIDEEGFVFAFDMKGNLKWKSLIGKAWVESYDGVRTTPMIHKGKLYILSAYGLLVCMDPKDGKQLWTKDMMAEYGAPNIRWGFCENLVAFGDYIFVTAGGTDANVVAIDVNDGSLVWKSAGNGKKSAYCSPIVINHGGLDMLVTQTAGFIQAVNVVNGELLWSHPFENKYSIHPNTALYKDGKLYSVSGYGSGGVMLDIAADGKSVKEVWKTTDLDNQMGGVILHNNKLYGAGHKSRSWHCLDWETGKEIKREKVFGKGGNTIFADGMLYFYSEAGKVVLIKPEDNGSKVVSSFDVPYGEKQHWAHLVIDNKKLYVRHGSSIMVYDISK